MDTMDLFLNSFINSFKFWDHVDAAGVLVKGDVSAWFQWSILTFMIIGLSIVFERFYYIVIRSNINADKFMERIRQFVASNNIKEAIALAEQSKEKALPYIVLKGLKRADTSKDFRDIQNAVDEATLEVIPRLTNRIGYLTMIASASTLLGLAGTIFGLIIAFGAVGGTGIPAAQKSQFLANGISAAMGTTMMGLFSAIPITVLLVIIQARTQKIIDEIDEHTVKLINLLTGYRPVVN